MDTDNDTDTVTVTVTYNDGEVGKKRDRPQLSACFRVNRPTHQDYNMNSKAHCIFCDIAHRQEPSVVIHEDDRCFAFMDIHPLGQGHVLVVPKVHATRLEELDNRCQAHLFDIANKIIDAQRKAGFGKEGTNLLINDGKAANQTIPHVHVHLIPRKSGDLVQSAVRLVMHLSGFFGFRTSTTVLEQQANSIKKALLFGTSDNSPH